MKCEKCGFENKKSAKFCASCGTPLEPAPVGGDSGTNNSKYIIIALVIVIIMLVAVMGYFAGSMNSNNVQTANDVVENSSSQSVDSSGDGADEANGQTQAVSSSESKTTTVEKSKSWEPIGSYSGSGSGSQSISVPSGEIMVKLSAYPIKNYATNHLYVTGPNGESGGVDWGSHSDVETRSDSFTCTLSSSETFTIDYYETVSWEVEFYRYQ